MGKDQKPQATEAFILIPAAVLNDPRLESPAEMLVYSAILGFSRKGEYMKGGRPFVARLLHQSERHAGRVLQSLERKGLIRKVELSSKGNVTRWGYLADGPTGDKMSTVTGDKMSATGDKMSPVTGDKMSHSIYTGEYIREKRARANPFNQFEQHPYTAQEMAELERILTQD